MILNEFDKLCRTQSSMIKVKQKDEYDSVSNIENE